MESHSERSAGGTTTLPEQIENIVVMARAVAAETLAGTSGDVEREAMARCVRSLEEALMWAERAEDGGP